MEFLIKMYKNKKQIENDWSFQLYICGGFFFFLIRTNFRENL